MTTRGVPSSEKAVEAQKVLTPPTPATVVVNGIRTTEKPRQSGPGVLPLTEIVISGNRAGLYWLAQKILAVAEAAPGVHTHLDREAYAPVYRSAADWGLTIALEE